MAATILCPDDPTAVALRQLASECEAAAAAMGAMTIPDQESSSTQGEDGNGAAGSEGRTRDGFQVEAEDGTSG